MNQHKRIHNKTGKLFGDLWRRYDDTLFDASVKLFYQRFKANGFDLKWFRGKRCLDAGCGGGRYAIAMATLGASKVIGCDLSFEGLTDARRRAADVANIMFEEASVIDLPFPNKSFDFVCCSGVLHHTTDPEKGLQELTRVLRPSGKIFLLLYGTGGLRWPAIMGIRPFAQSMGYELIDEALKLADLPSNKQRTFLDDFFVPLIRFYRWDEVQSMLTRNGFKKLDRWEKSKLDHEESVSIQLHEFKQIRKLFETAIKQDSPSFRSAAADSRNALGVVESAIDRLEIIETDFAAGKIDKSNRSWEVFGEGHHRVVAEKG